MKKYRLGDIAKVEISGVDKKIKENETEVLLCNFTNVYHNWNITKDCESNFMKATANKNEITKFSIHKGQVALTKDSETRDDIGVSTYIADDFENVLLGYHCALVTPDEKILNGNYLNCLLNTKTYQRYFENNASGSGQRFTLSVETLNNIPLSLPPIDEQECIAKVLFDIDSKITLNKKTNRELETMAKEIYDYWFVQFDFPNEEGKQYKSSGGKMQWNDVLKQKIPAGWEVRKLSDIANITMGQSPQGSSYNENSEGTIFYQGCADFGERFPDVRVYTTEPSRFAKKGDVLMSVRAPVGTVNIANEDCCIGRGLAAINSKIGSMMYLEFIIKDFKTIFDNKGGTTFSSITKDELYNLPVIEPDKKVVGKFEEICKPINFQLSTVNSQLKQLNKLRDELLPLLMNGQVAVNSNSPENKNRIKQIPNYNERYNQWVKTHGLAARGTVDDEVLRAIFDAIHDDDK